LLKIDEDMMAEARAQGCPLCGGPLHSAVYPRKPRGGPSGLSPAHGKRLSLCCARRNCRLRRTPPSARFLGRRVFFGGVVVLASAMQCGVTPTRARKLRELLGVSLRTLKRWRRWWREAFLQSAFWTLAKARFSPAIVDGEVPSSLLERFGSDGGDARLIALLGFLGPLTTPKGYVPDQRF
jgi:hypothetical protein